MLAIGAALLHNKNSNALTMLVLFSVIGITSCGSGSNTADTSEPETAAAVASGLSVTDAQLLAGTDLVGPDSETPAASSQQPFVVTDENSQEPAIGAVVTDSTSNNTGSTSENTTGNTTDSTTGNTTDSTTGNTTDSTTGNTTDSTTGNTTDSSTGNTTDSTTGTTTDSTTGTTTDSTTGSTTDSTTGSTTDSTTGSTTDSTTGSTTDSTTGSTTDSTTGSTTDSTTGSTTDSTTGSTTDSTTNTAVPDTEDSESDTTAPELLNVAVADITSFSASFTWTLSETATGQIEYGETSDYGNFSIYESSFNYSTHIQSLSGLKSDTEYHYRILGIDPDGNELVSENKVFRTEVGSTTDTGPTDFVTNVNVETKGWPSNSNDDLPQGGVFYGFPGAGVYGAANTGIAHEHSIRFRADKSGLIDKVSFQNRILEDSDLPARCDKGRGKDWCNCVDNGLKANACAYTLGNAYHVGNGGHIQIQIYADDGTSNHRPDESKLLGAVNGFYVPTTIKDLSFPSHDLQSPVQVVAGGIYHIVLKNLAPPPALSRQSNSVAKSINPNVGAISLNGVLYPTSAYPEKRFGPFFGRHGKGTLRRNSTSGPWTENANTHSYWEVHYTDGTWVGETWSAWDVSFGHPGSRTIEGSTKARQVFKVEDANRRVNGVWLNYGHSPSSAISGKPLNVQVKNSSGTVLATALLAADFPTDAINKQNDWYEKVSRTWGYADLSKTVEFVKGNTYNIEFSAPGGAGFAISALPYNSRGLLGRNRNEWENAHAELSTNGGSSWKKFHSAGSYPERDIPVLFTVEGMPKHLP